MPPTQQHTNATVRDQLDQLKANIARLQHELVAKDQYIDSLEGEVRQLRQREADLQTAAKYWEDLYRAEVAHPLPQSAGMPWTSQEDR